MLAGARHAHKVNFCKFTNETRNGIEDASEAVGLKTICVDQRHRGRRRLRACARADYIVLVDDGASAVSLPELAAARGAAWHRRDSRAVTDKRKVRPRSRRLLLHHRGRASRASARSKWRLVDEVVAQGSKFDERSLRAQGTWPRNRNAPRRARASR
jgi:benzoyl-CoA-dihydrodiol lyase